MNDTAENTEQQEKPAGPEAPLISAPKRRPGRPPGSKNKPGVESIPSEPNAVPGSPAVSKKGRPPGKKKPQAISVGDLSKQIQGLHHLAAMVTGIGELQLAEPEAEMLAKAVVSVSEQYDLAIDGKTGALIQLAAACAVIYLPRLVHVKKRAIAKRTELHAVPDAPAP